MDKTRKNQNQGRGRSGSGERLITRVTKYPGPGALKRCTRCKQWKRVSSFYKDAHTKTGVDYYCKDCRRELAALYRKHRPRYNSRYQKRHRQELHYIKALLGHALCWRARYGIIFPLPEPSPVHLPVEKWKRQIEKELGL